MTALFTGVYKHPQGLGMAKRLWGRSLTLFLQMASSNLQTMQLFQLLLLHYKSSQKLVVKTTIIIYDGYCGSRNQEWFN